MTKGLLFSPLRHFFLEFFVVLSPFWGFQHSETVFFWIIFFQIGKSVSQGLRVSFRVFFWYCEVAESFLEQFIWANLKGHDLFESSAYLSSHDFLGQFQFHFPSVSAILPLSYQRLLSFSLDVSIFFQKNVFMVCHFMFLHFMMIMI